MNSIFHASLEQYSINTRNPCVRVHTHKDDREDVTSIQPAFTDAISALDLAVIALRYIFFVRAFG